MKTNLVRKDTIEDYVAADPRRRLCFAAWLIHVKHTRLFEAADIKREFPSAQLLERNTNRAVFSIGNNNFKIITIYAFDRRCTQLIVCWVGETEEYEKLTDEQRQTIFKRN